MVPAEFHTAADLQSAIEARCACAAALIQTVPVRASVGGHMLDVDVHVFELADCAKASTAYAWTAADRVFTALDIGRSVRPPAR